MTPVSLPSVTLILPIRNEAPYIERCLTAVLHQDYSGFMEILIADGMSTDDTRKIITDFAVLHPHLQLHILENRDKIVPTGMNIALRKASGEILIRVDGHCLIASDYVRKCVEHIQKDHVDGVGGPMETIGETFLAQAIAIGMSSSFGVGNSAFRTLQGRTILADTVPFPAYTRQIIKRAGFYDEELVRNQDDEYNYRIRQLGGKILLAEDVRSSYFSRCSWRALWRQYYQYGFWKVRVLQKYPHQMSQRQFVPPAFVASLIASALIYLFPFPAFSLHPSHFIPLLYLVANLLASSYTASHRGWRYLPYLPFVFAILHFSYGLGFLVGLAKFWNRWDDKFGKAPIWEGIDV